VLRKIFGPTFICYVQQIRYLCNHTCENLKYLIHISAVTIFRRLHNFYFNTFFISPQKRRDSSADRRTELTAGVRFPAGQAISLYSAVSRTARGPSQPPTHSVQEVRLSERETAHQHKSSTLLKNGGTKPLFPHMSPRCGSYLIKHNDIRYKPKALGFESR
jgi:hypothetical protein